MTMAQTTPVQPSEMSIDEWAALPEDEPGELVEGKLVEEEVPDLTHETVVAWLIRVLGAWLVPLGGFVFGSEVKYAVATRRGRKPDVTAFLPDRGPLPRRGPVRIPLFVGRVQGPLRCLRDFGLARAPRRLRA